MSSRLFDRIDDALNPIVVKELRQAVKGRIVTAMFSLFLTISLIVVTVILMNVEGRHSTDFDAGRDVLLSLQTIVMGTCLLFLPTYAAIRLASERSDTNVDLLFISTIEPGTVVRGKFLSSCLLAAIIFAACMPFMTLSFLLRGVDLPSVALVLAVGFLIVV
ncbi:MAG: hypothetical protein AAF517_24870, partial [Planctomycetota bacterium]